MRALRLVEKDGTLEMGLIPANIGSTGDATFVLARLVNGQWEEVWSPAGGPRATWAGSGGSVEFQGSGIDALKLQGPIPSDVTASRVFDEFGVFLKQQYESEWRRQGDEYVRVNGHVVQTPLTALADFLDRLQKGDTAGALRLANDPAVVDAALKLGLNETASGRGWVGASQAASGGTTYIGFFDNESRERSFLAALVQAGDGYRVQTIEKVPPVPNNSSIPLKMRVRSLPHPLADTEVGHYVGADVSVRPRACATKNRIFTLNGCSMEHGHSRASGNPGSPYPLEWSGYPLSRA